MRTRSGPRPTKRPPRGGHFGSSRTLRREPCATPSPSRSEVHNARVSQILLFAAIASVALVLGAAIGIRWLPPTPVLAAILAFAGGALTAALAFELFEESFQHGGLVTSSLGLIAGAAAFIAIDMVLERRVRRRGGDVAGPALLVVVVLDG